jgi:hypothetical protein
VTTNRTPDTHSLQPYRWRDNPEEQRFAEAWARINLPVGTTPCTGPTSVRSEHRPTTCCTTTLAYLLSTEQHRPPEPSSRDHVVAATVVQWLGSPGGTAFLQDLGYVRLK